MNSHHRFWPRRLPHAIVPPQTSLWDNLAISARRYPDKAALVFFGRTVSYRALEMAAQRMAAFLHRLGVRKGTGCCCACRTVRNWCWPTLRSCGPMRWWCRSTP
jgi:non-ribosomal peptide synthetase component E (peptide arylation enzyme)